MCFLDQSPKDRYVPADDLSSVWRILSVCLVRSHQEKGQPNCVDTRIKKESDSFLINELVIDAECALDVEGRSQCMSHR
jgi:hypothetical protein